VDLECVETNILIVRSTDKRLESKTLIKRLAEVKVIFLIFLIEVYFLSLFMF
jgi:hypothetical protein